MPIKIAKTINLSDAAIACEPLVVQTPYMANEPDGALSDFYLAKGRTMDKHSSFVQNYDAARFNENKRSLTTRMVERIGIKAFPSIGSYGFFKYKYENRSILLAPIYTIKRKFAGPTIVVTHTPDGLKIVLTSPKDITYECFKIILRNGAFAFEHVTYEKEVLIPYPDVKGFYDVYAVGYLNEGAYCSFDSEVYTYQQSSGRPDFKPVADEAYYSKEQIDAMIGDIGKLLDRINGEVI